MYGDSYRRLGSITPFAVSSSMMSCTKRICSTEKRVWSRKAAKASAAFLDQTRFSVEQIRFVQLIIDELTANGVMEPSRLYESPYIDHGHLDVIFPHEVGMIVKILRDVKA